IGQRRTQRHSGTDGGRQLRASPVGGGSVPRVVELQQETTLFVGPTTEGGRERARRCGVVGEGGQREGSFLVVACPDVRDTTAGLESESMQGLHEFGQTGQAGRSCVEDLACALGRGPHGCRVPASPNPALSSSAPVTAVRAMPVASSWCRYLSAAARNASACACTVAAQLSPVARILRYPVSTRTPADRCVDPAPEPSKTRPPKPRRISSSASSATSSSRAATARTASPSTWIVLCC